MNQKGFANIILVIVIVVLVGAVGYFAFVKKSEPTAQQPTPAPTQTNTAVSPTPTPKDETVGWKTYTNAQHGFEFKYPATFVLGQNPKINDWSKPIEEGTPGTFWQKIAKSRWQERLTKKNSYQVGSLCATSSDYFEESCRVISLNPYAMKYVVMTATGKVNTYYVISDSIEVVFDPVVPRDGAVLDGASDQILSTFKFTK